ncbi:hydroxyacid dehydrogenase [Rhodococcus sp. WMMA185]|nr:hydroxyacid dehydrogenase [Rhodococcus sp. WMMA185]
MPNHELMAPVEDRAEVRYTDEAGLIDALDGADVLFLYDFLTDAVPGAWHAAGSLQWLHIAAAGVDPVMFPEIRDSDVTVTNSRGVFDGAIAEYVLAQIFSFAKDLPGSLRLQQAHTWRHRESERVAGKTALIVGTGPIGRATARLLRAVGMEVNGSGRRARDTDPDFRTVAATEDLPEQLAAADYVIAAAPLTDQTRHMFRDKEFAAMKPGARFINVGRGELVCTDDLVAALESGTIAGAALDVFDTEPLPPDHPLWSMPNVSITPHNSGDFTGWRDEIVTVFTDNFERWTAGRPLENIVDKELGYVPSR